MLIGSRAGSVCMLLLDVCTRGFRLFVLLLILQSASPFGRSASTFGQSTAPQLILDPVNIRQDGIVSFSTLSLGSESRSDLSEQQYILGQTEEQNFRLSVDTASIQQVRFNAFTFTAYLVEAKDVSQKAYKFQVTGNPTGSFADVPARVLFHVKTSGGTYAGSIQIPVYNAAKADLLLTDKQPEPAHVSVSGATGIRIPLRNVTASLPVQVTDVAVTGDCAKCWTHLSSPVSEKAPLILDPGASGQLDIKVEPNSIPALLQGALVIKTDLPHDTLSVIVRYHTVPGGPEKKQTLSASVRFGPGLFGLGLALCGGVLLGLTARYFLTGKVGKRNERIVHAVLSALVLGLVAEFIGIMLTAYGNSKLVLLGLDIDPRQLFPAFVLAMLVSGGSAVKVWMKEILPKRR